MIELAASGSFHDKHGTAAFPPHTWEDRLQPVLPQPALLEKGTRTWGRGRKSLQSQGAPSFPVHRGLILCFPAPSAPGHSITAHAVAMVTSSEGLPRAARVQHSHTAPLCSGTERGSQRGRQQTQEDRHTDKFSTCRWLCPCFLL